MFSPRVERIHSCSNCAPTAMAEGGETDEASVTLVQRRSVVISLVPPPPLPLARAERANKDESEGDDDGEGDSDEDVGGGRGSRFRIRIRMGKGYSTPKSPSAFLAPRLPLVSRDGATDVGPPTGIRHRLSAEVASSVTRCAMVRHI